MATLKPIQFKRSKTAGSRPLPEQVLEGELALNLEDRMIFTKDDEGNIIDLGFAKGGRVDGDIVQVGNYTQTGDYTTSGDINAKTITASAGVVSNGDLKASTGVIRTRGGNSGNAHLWFEGEEVGLTNNYERGVMYALPQTATEGTINLRVMNGFDNSKAQSLFSFRGNGDFSAPRDLVSQRGRFSIEAVAPTINTTRIYTRDKPWRSNSDESYGWLDLVNYVPGENGALALNYVYKGRAMSGGTIWHQLVDERTGPEWALYTGSGPENKAFAVGSSAGKGLGNFTGSLHVGNPGYSAIGNNSITIGETNTGLRQTSAGNLDFLSANNMAFRFSAGEAINRSYNRLHIQHSDANGNAVNPPANNAQLQVNTSGDENNPGGNGLTLIGYYAGATGEYNHYFRGKGSASFDMHRGVNINQGGLNVYNGLTNVGQINLTGSMNTTNVPQGTYKWDDLNTVAADAKSYLRRFRSRNNSTIWHETVEGGIWRLSTGSTDAQEELQISTSGVFKVRGEVIALGNGGTSGTGNHFRAIYGNYGFFIRNDGSNTYFMLTNSGDQYGGWNTFRPFTISNGTGRVSMGNGVGISGGLTVSPGIESEYVKTYTGSIGHGSWASQNDNEAMIFQRITSASTSEYCPILKQKYIGGNRTWSIGTLINVGSFHIHMKDSAGNDRNFAFQPNGDFNGANTINASAISVGSARLSSIATPGGGQFDNDGNVYINKSGFAGWIDALFVKKNGDTMSSTLNINANGPGINMNCPTGGSTYVIGRRNGVNGFYVGMGGTGNDATFHSYLNNTTINLRASDIQFSRTVYGDGDANFNNVYIRSDIRLKRNFKKIENALDKVDKLDGLIYEKKNTRESTEYETTEAGIIAQTLRSVLPEAVSEHEGTLNVSASGTIALLVNAIKELKARVEELESK
ncbi:long tail fiber distal subunit [Serratia phage vB_SspM_LC53]|nr:long tail fiber distal subunit [Serratia phage vB_SspM_LC53]